MPSTPAPNPFGDRQLAAILFTDVVGFSGLMEANETRTMALVQRDLKFIAAVCKEFGGEVLKNTGDGCLATFRSVESAVRTALRIQTAVAEAAQRMPPEKILHHRIGIHLGDVFMGKGDVLGNGVNIAARLLGEAEPDGICISQAVYDLVKNRVGIKAVFIGARELKNIRDAVPVYRLLLGAAAKEQSDSQPDTAVKSKSGNRLLMFVAAAVLIAAGCIGAWLGLRNKSPEVAAPSVPVMAMVPATMPATQPVQHTFIDEIIQRAPTYVADAKATWQSFPQFANDNVRCGVENRVFAVTVVADGFRIGVPVSPWGIFSDVTIEATGRTLGTANSSWGVSLISNDGTSRKVVRVLINEKGVARIDRSRIDGLDDTTGRALRAGDIQPFANQFIHRGDLNNTILLNVNNHMLAVRINGQPIGDAVDITPLGRTALHMTVEGNKSSRAEFTGLRLWLPATGGK